MSSRFDVYVSRPSWLHALDPRTKIAFVGVSFALLLTTHHLSVVVAYVAAVHLLFRAAGLPWSPIRWLWARMWPVSLLILILWPLFYTTGEPVLLTWWRIRITAPSLIQGLVSALRIVALAFAMLVLLVSTSQARLVQGLQRLGMPYEWSLALAIGLRYLPLLDATYQTIKDAQRARGWSSDRGSLLQRARAYLPTLVALVIAALRLSDALTLALTARGFQPGQPRTTRSPLRMRPRDWWSLAVLACLLVLTLLLAI